MENNSIIHNRLKKNHKKLKSWLKQESIEAYRLYEKDIPEYPYIVDIYKNYAVIYEKGKKLEEDELNLRQKHLNQVFDAIKSILDIDETKIVLKKREVQKGKFQYEKEDDEDQRFVVREGKAQFYVNLYDYLDTGLFLDHRPLRKIINKEAKSKKVLNLFAYTGSISIAAALGGGHVTTVDMSKTYINWAYDNFRLNNIQFSAHSFIAKNAFDFLKEDQQKYDIIVLDPPSFSNSKRMDGTFDVQRDHLGLIDLCMNRLADNGKLYFSNNFRKFKMDNSVLEKYLVKDITKISIPRDFRDDKIHCCFEIMAKCQ
jgi:23S rRNA (cytosine1962-C5)-methyltransferase